jgi:hypothetical protein
MPIATALKNTWFPFYQLDREISTNTNVKNTNTNTVEAT